ncbi:unnamed protein product [Staurois parvus]|uniref:Uncharacterized protein n=1 Tax=Staurois parvus TaxID=386267 RepID=A0ABN9EK50_9NEOB|nr:unnamed protein product [Staurois parvus]
MDPAFTLSGFPQYTQHGIAIHLVRLGSTDPASTISGLPQYTEHGNAINLVSSAVYSRLVTSISIQQSTS